MTPRRTPRPAALVALALSLGACSALGLSDGLDEREPCRACEELNAIEPPGECYSWQCNNRVQPGAGVCVVDLQDEDADGSPDAMCALDEREPDCADADANNGWLIGETCDLVDNDCDGAVDENSLAVARTELASAEEVRGLSFARGDSGVVGVYRAAQGALVVSTLPLLGASASTSRLTAATNPDPREAVLARTGTDWAVALTPTSGCSRIALGAWPGTGTRFEAPAAHFSVGLPKVGGDCESGDTSPVGAPAIASASPQQVLLAYLADASTRGCDAVPAAAEVAVVAAQRSSNEGAFVGTDQLSPSAVRVGDSVDSAPPAVLAIGGAYGYLVAFPEADEAVALYRAQVDASTRAITVTAAGFREPCEGPCGDVALASFTVAGETQVALSYRRGTCDSSRAALRRLQLEGTTWSAIGEVFESASAPGLRYPTTSRRTAPDEWVLGWVVTAGATRSVRALRLDSMGVAIGDEIVLLETTGSFTGPAQVLGGQGRDGLAAFAFDADAGQLVRGAALCATES